MRKIDFLLVIIAIVILIIGLCVYDKGSTKIYRVYEFSLELEEK